MQNDYQYLGEMDAVTGDPAVVSTVTDDCQIYHEIPNGGGVYDPGFVVGSPPAPVRIEDDPRVRDALARLDQAVAAGPGGIDERGFFGIPWPWIAGGLLVALVMRK